jgi:hypothetical protein
LYANHQLSNEPFILVERMLLTDTTAIRNLIDTPQSRD